VAGKPGDAVLEALPPHPARPIAAAAIKMISLRTGCKESTAA
jgi:hypothetical protein